MLGYLINIARDLVLPILMDRTETLLDRAEHGRRDTYLASSADIGELERRMRECDTEA
ncbi:MULTISPECIES: DUF3563 family protein [Caballeronia]|uniref:Uncharacterized protein n=1 Tax=Caballeronia cordobensis TaxID=1353886 RepID=A0A158H3B6_CABCO|nr:MULTISPECIES: DUF3563 family protein [Caballeronia]BAO92054.1 uncharacterized protein BRPE67_DCDS08990 [Burkholderia sp. RPE67]BBQ01893.1 hypothetical protein BSFA1_70210 [Burkholderia sp. SFA1]MCE4546795.1 DUF3563 domain-containing protein [Caballeronia sp. PC1]MCE4572732.1 DUF3563 domain-containing protein [Caballeronia sp. CLC5]SAL38815.1 hypothetical protein AWB70_02868 [Caballeronia cordobensis]